ncbi:MAG: hypothetical protein DHS20C14_02010 [Phycisphaeraceae bacterium]|nr:MAG: hypothetical protein DHS20C14_02010 [Phycisphaeraceae bacterium]
MRDLPLPDEEDARLMRRVRRRAERGEAVSPDAAVRIAWVCARRWGDPDAADRLAACLGDALDVDGARALVRTVRAADLASSTPAGTSAEFVWRHPELMDGGNDDDELSADPAPVAETAGLGSRLVRALRMGRRSG